LIRGWLADDRPYIRAEVVIPVQDSAGRTRTHTAFVDFHVDTGSDATVIARGEFERSLGLSLDQTMPGLPSVGIGASAPTRTIHGYLFFDDESGRRAVASVRFVLVDADPATEIRGYSLLGCDVILQGRLTLDHDTVLLDLPVVRASA
jgi:hypothetical protein